MPVLSSVQWLSHVWLSAIPWTAARRASLSITNSWSLLKRMSMESVTPSNHLILCCPLLLLLSIFPSIRVFSNESMSLVISYLILFFFKLVLVILCPLHFHISFWNQVYQYLQRNLLGFWLGLHGIYRPNLVRIDACQWKSVDLRKKWKILFEPNWRL